MRSIFGWLFVLPLFLLFGFQASGQGQSALPQTTEDIRLRPDFQSRLKPVEEALKELQSPLDDDKISVEARQEAEYRKATYVAAVKDFVTGQRLETAGNLEQAAERMGPALAAMHSLKLKTPITVSARYGAVLLRLGRLNEAIHVLEQGVNVEAQAEAQYQLGQRRAKEYFLGVAMQQAKLKLQTSAAVPTFSQGYIFENVGEQQYADDRSIWTPIHLSISQLLDAYSRSGNPKAAYALYDNHFSKFLTYEPSWFDPDGRNGYSLREAACTPAAIALARLGKDDRADQAFQCALNSHRLRALHEAKFSASQTVIRGNATQYRLLLGAYLDYFRKTSQLGNAAIAQKNLSLIVEGKGLSQRYLQSRTASSNTLAGDKADDLRASVKELERSALKLPATGRSVIDAYSNWLDQDRAAYFNVHQKMVSDGFRETFIDGQEVLSRIQGKLREQAVVGYFIYATVDEKTGGPGVRRLMRYLVWDNGVEMRDVGEVTEAESLIFRWRRGDQAALQALTDKLLIELPAPAVAAKQWVIDPDGSLNLLPFEVLPLPGGVAVLDKYITRYVTALASLAVDPVPPTKVANTALLLADPVYPQREDRVNALQTAYLNAATTRGATLLDAQLTPLPETKEEVNEIASSLKRMGVTPNVKTGEQASLDALDFQSPPRFLHIAAHGLFIVPTPAASQGSSERFALNLPELQSVVVLSKSSQGALLTGLRLSQLPLQGTELVVLSACDTGSGYAQAGEGVSGLRNAIEIAGARASITSLWPVPSNATKDLMAGFYKYLTAGMTKPAALREAKLAIRRTTPDIRAWAGFILAVTN